MQRKHKITLMCAAVMIVLAAALSLVMKLREDNRVVRIGFIHVSDEGTPYTANFIKAQEAIKEKYGRDPNNELFTGGFIFASKSKEDARAEAKEKEGLKTGLEPVDPKKTKTTGK